MKEIIITTQEQLNSIKEVKVDEYLIIDAELILNSIIEVFGKLRINFKLGCSWQNSFIAAWGNSSVVAWENSSVVAWGNSSVEAWGNSSVEAWGNSCIRLFSVIKNIILNGYSVCFVPLDLQIRIKKSENVVIQKFKQEAYLSREGVPIKNNKVIVFKKVSFDFKTQENTKNETLWTIGTTLIHPNWNPAEQECGEGKYHACSRPYFCDEFRNNKGDRYIAIEVAVKDLYEWKDPQYPHKIAFRKCKVLYECAKFGKELK